MAQSATKPKMITIVKRPLSKQASVFKEDATKRIKVDEETKLREIRCKVPSANDLRFPASARSLIERDPRDDPHRVFAKVVAAGSDAKQFTLYSSYGALACNVALEEGRHEDARWCQTVAFCRKHVARFFEDSANASGSHVNTVGARQKYQEFIEECRNQIKAAKIDAKAGERVVRSLDLCVEALVDPREEIASGIESDYAAKVASDVVYLRSATISKTYVLSCFGRELLSSSGKDLEALLESEASTDPTRPFASPADVELYCYGDNPGTNDASDFEAFLQKVPGDGAIARLVRYFLMLKKSLLTTGARRLADLFFEEVRRSIFVEFDALYPRVSHYGYVVPSEYVGGLAPPHRYVPNVGENDPHPSDDAPKTLLELLDVRKREMELDEGLRVEGVEFFAMPGSASVTAGMGLPLERMMPAAWIDHLNAYLASLPRYRGGGKGMTLDELPWFRSMKILKHREYASKLPYLPASPLDLFNFMNWLPDPKNVRVVIVGEGPYPNRRHACGVAFSTPPDFDDPEDVPASERILLNTVRNKVKPEWVSEETKHWDTVGGPNATCLKRWCDQGVLLINASLNVIDSSFDPVEHPDVPFNDHKPKDASTSTFVGLVLESLGNRDNNVIFLVYGEDAKGIVSKCAFPKSDKLMRNASRVLFAPHPSPRGGNLVAFEENAGFEEANQFLIRRGQKPVLW